jgi:poly-gamma-glutamate capsule biosynthesis protein CapA/YwtB (metallophosphatase superfamily)
MSLKIILIFLIIVSAGVSRADSLKILFLGDTYFGESYQTNPGHNDGINVIDEYGYDYFFENVKTLLNSSKFTIANLETSLASRQSEYLTKAYSHWSTGSKTCEYLKKYGIDAVSLGNNHVMDYGSKGMTETIALLDKHNIKYFGGGNNAYEAGAPLTVNFALTEKYFGIAVLGGYKYRPSYDTIYHAYANDSTAGINMLDTAKIIKQVRQLKEHNKDVFVVFFPHWGKNYKQAVDYQKEMAHMLIDAGVDLVIGHGAHTIQQTEMYKEKLIVYNIGNFIFNAPGRYKSTGAKPYSFITELVVKDGKKYVRLYPLYVNNNKTDYRLRFLDEEEFNDCFEYIGNSFTKKKGTEYFEIELF